MNRLDGKVAVVTAAASGIGRAAAALFIAEGASVVLADVDGENANKAAAEFGDRALAVSCDVSDPVQVEAAVAAAVKHFGGLDIMFNNAGISGGGVPLVDLAVNVWQRVLAVNLFGVFHGIKYAAPEIAARGGGAIINTASLAGLKSFPNEADYCASKAGVLALTRSAAIELRASKIRVNAILPGYTRTPGAEAAEHATEGKTGERVSDRIAQRQGRFAEPDELAKVALHLASAESSFTSGLSYIVDNGMSASG